MWDFFSLQWNIWTWAVDVFSGAGDKGMSISLVYWRVIEQTTPWWVGLHKSLIRDCSTHFCQKLFQAIFFATPAWTNQDSPVFLVNAPKIPPKNQPPMDKSKASCLSKRLSCVQVSSWFFQDRRVGPLLVVLNQVLSSPRRNTFAKKHAMG